MTAAEKKLAEVKALTREDLDSWPIMRFGIQERRAQVLALFDEAATLREQLAAARADAERLAVALESVRDNVALHPVRMESLVAALAAHQYGDALAERDARIRTEALDVHQAEMGERIQRAASKAREEGRRAGQDEAIVMMRKYLQFHSQRAVSWHEVEDCIAAIRATAAYTPAPAAPKERP